MEKADKKIKAKIMQDCRRIMLPSVLIYVIQETALSVLAVYIAGRLGVFLDSVIRMNLGEGMENIVALLICVAVGVLLLPFVGFLGETVMLQESLAHDRMVLGHFFNKTYAGAMSIEEGEAQFRLENDSIELRCDWRDIVVKTIVTVLAMFYLLYSALPVSVLYTVIVFGVSLLKLSVPIGIQKLNAKYDRENREYFTNVRVYENVLTHSPWQVKLFGIKERVLDRLDHLYKENYENVQSKNIVLQTVSKNVSEFLDQFCILLILIAGVYLVAGKQITPGVTTTMIGYFSVFNLIIANSGEVIKLLPVQKNIVERMITLYDNEEDMTGKEVDGEIGSIETRGLAFHYTDSEQSAIKYDDIMVEKGSKFPLCGANGCGKTTFLKLLCKLQNGYEGSMKINGKEVSELSAESLRKQMSYIAQEPYLFKGSVLDNIWIGNLKASKEEVIGAAKQVGIEALLGRTIGSDKQDLSGGERQKIAMARAILKGGSVYLLDEPEKNLDVESIQWLKGFMKQTEKTMVYVTHDERLKYINDH